MNRRNLLSTIAVTGASVGVASKSTAKKPVAPDQPIRIALIGAKNIGGKTHLPTLVGDPDCLLVAVCDVDQTVANELAKNAEKLYADAGKKVSVQISYDYRELMKDDSIDAVVVVATPDHWHVPLTKAAVLAGKDVYVEKPLSFYVTEGRELLNLVNERDVIVQVGSQHRSDDRFFLAEAIVQSGLIGDVKHADVAIRTRPGDNKTWKPMPVPPELDYDMYVGPAPWTDYNKWRCHYNFRFVPDFSGGEIANWGAHFLDSAQQAMGLDATGPIKVQGKGRRHPSGSVHYSYYNIDVDYEYENGITMKFLTREPMGCTFYGDKGTLFVNRNKLSIDPSELMKQLPKAEAKALRKTKGSHMQNWFKCIRSRRKEDLHAPLEIANRSANLCHLANTAIELGRPLEWNAKDEVFRNDAHANAMLSRPVREKWRV